MTEHEATYHRAARGERVVCSCSWSWVSIGPETITHRELVREHETHVRESS